MAATNIKCFASLNLITLINVERKVLPRLAIKPLALEKILVKYFSFRLNHQKGSHMILLDDNGHMVVIPLYNKELKEGTLHSILNHAGLTKKDIMKYK